jgi:hypothetical protein
VGSREAASVTHRLPRRPNGDDALTEDRTTDGSTRSNETETTMSGKNKGGREDRKPKQEQNKKHKGVAVPPQSSTLDAVNHTGQRPKK